MKMLIQRVFDLQIVILFLVHKYTNFTKNILHLETGRLVTKQKTFLQNLLVILKRMLQYCQKIFRNDSSLLHAWESLLQFQIFIYILVRTEGVLCERQSLQSGRRFLEFLNDSRRDFQASLKKYSLLLVINGSKKKCWLSFLSS